MASMKTLQIHFPILLLALCLGSIGHAVEPFKPGERVAFLGDSITHYGTWWPSIWCAYVERHPENPPIFFNAGFSGDRSSRALGRLERDVFSLKPDTVCVMFGMNDVPSPNESALNNYRRSMDKLLKEIQESMR